MPSIMEKSTSGKDNNKDLLDSGKYVRYTNEQVEVLERAYNECSKPSSGRRLQLIRENPILSNIEPKQIKVWFQNRRCRDKQRKETSRLLSWNGKFTAMNQLLLEENERLRKQATQLDSENQYLRQQLQLMHARVGSNPASLQQTALPANDTTSDSVITSGQLQQNSPQHPSCSVSTSRLFTIAEETLAEFLAKATGTAVDWIQMPGMKPGPESIGVVAVAQACGGLAVQAWGVFGMEPSKVVEVLRDESSWLYDCRKREVLGTFHSANGQIVEFIYTQMYAPTTLAPPRSFYTLRYTSNLDDGSFVICERSLPPAQGPPVISQSKSFVHGDILSSGCLIQPCQGRGALVIMVDHRDLKASTVPELLHPLYESSTFFMQKMTLEASYHLQATIQPETSALSQKIQQPYDIRSYSQRLCRGFNEAVNALPDDGWISLSKDGMGDIAICIKPLSNCKPTQNEISMLNSPSSTDMGILCVKASLLLQEVSPSMLARFLREKRTEWTNCETELNYKRSLHESTQTSAFCNNLRQVFMPLTRPVNQDEFLELIKLESSGQENDIASNEAFILQLCNGLNETTSRGWAQLVFAPVDSSLSDDLPLLPSGFRIITINNYMDQCSLSRTLDLTSHLEGGPEARRLHTAGEFDVCFYSSVLTVAFQWTYEAETRDLVALKAHHYAQRVLEFVKKAVLLLRPACGTSQTAIRPYVFSLESKMLVYTMMQKYRSCFGMDLFKTGNSANCDIIFRAFWNHQDAIVCCASKNIPEYVFANQAGLHMLEITEDSLPGLPWEKTIPESEKEIAYKDLFQVLHQGYAYIPAGVRVSSKGRAVAFERAVAWDVLDGNSNTDFVAIMFMNWSFLQ
uniref:Class III HD-Zip protein HDZ1 n=1 Tax=Cunninghamia lanceolata TaxID=28977 RepID=A0A0A7DP45_CUNLA|nr:class III HD-Zip protein HDZ1 [Cunninghamia lanceolata]